MAGEAVTLTREHASVLHVPIVHTRGVPATRHVNVTNPRVTNIRYADTSANVKRSPVMITSSPRAHAGVHSQNPTQEHIEARAQGQEERQHDPTYEDQRRGSQERDGEKRDARDAGGVERNASGDQGREEDHHGDHVQRATYRVKEGTTAVTAHVKIEHRRVETEDAAAIITSVPDPILDPEGSAKKDVEHSAQERDQEHTTLTARTTAPPTTTTTDTITTHASPTANATTPPAMSVGASITMATRLSRTRIRYQRAPRTEQPGGDEEETQAKKEEPELEELGAGADGR